MPLTGNFPQTNTPPSFIPKQSIQSEPRRQTLGFFATVSVIIFLVSIAGAVGVFLWQKIITARINTLKQAIEQNRSEFEPTLIQELSRLDQRMKTVGDILSAHITPSAIFGILEQYTVKSVRFDNFKYSVENPEKISVNMKGEAQSFNSVAFQSDTFAKVKYFKNPIFSSLDLNDKGNVTFTFNADIDPKLISFSQKKAGEQSTSTSQ